MSADLTRSTFDSKKKFTGVRLQQGRVQLDSDWNEEVDILNVRDRVVTSDIVGKSGGPLGQAGFKISPSSSGKSFEISGGHYYVDGLLCENEGPILSEDQPDSPGYVALSTAGTYAIYLDVWERELTAAHDPDIREIALNGPDTATRTKLVWQVKAVNLGSIAIPTDCLAAATKYDEAIARQTGGLSARTLRGDESALPCRMPPSGGYSRLENQLYRVQVLKLGDFGSAIFVWSRDNASIYSNIKRSGTGFHISSNEIVITDPGKDAYRRFAIGQFVELTDDAHELHADSGLLLQITNVTNDKLTVSPVFSSDSLDPTKFILNPRLIRWEGHGTVDAGTALDGFIELENGVQVKFEAGSYRTGDYWQIPARTAIADVLWPTTVDSSGKIIPVVQSAMGIEHHYAKLAILKFDGTAVTEVADCRKLFPPLTELVSISIVGGDGQDVMPSEALEDPICIAVTNGNSIVANASVEFDVQSSGRIAATSADLVAGGVDKLVIKTDSNGIAQCYWRVGSRTDGLVQSCQAKLMASSSTYAPNAALLFTANLKVADKISYDPAGCSKLAGVGNVQKAIEELCRLTGGDSSCATYTVGQGGRFDTIGEALESLLKEGKNKSEIARVIRLCLLPGTQVHRKPLEIVDWNKSGLPVNIHIDGKGHGVVVQATASLDFSGATTLVWNGGSVIGETEDGSLLISGPDMARMELHGLSLRIRSSQRFKEIEDATKGMPTRGITIDDIIIAKDDFDREEMATELAQKLIDASTTIKKKLRDSLKESESKFEQLIKDYDSNDIESNVKADERFAFARNRVEGAAKPAYFFQANITDNYRILRSQMSLVKPHLKETREAIEGIVRYVLGCGLIISSGNTTAEVSSCDIDGDISFFSNPGGATISEETWRQLEALIEQYGLSVPAGRGDVRLLRNEFRRLLMPESFLGVYRAEVKGFMAPSRVLLDGNRLGDESSLAIAGSMMLASNNFYRVVGKEPHVFRLIANTASVFGNHAAEKARIRVLSKENGNHWGLNPNLEVY